LDVEYTITICNAGAGAEEIEPVTLNLAYSDDGSFLVLENFGLPPVGTTLLGPEDGRSRLFIEVRFVTFIDVCTEREPLVTLDVAAIASNTGIPCTDTQTPLNSILTRLRFLQLSAPVHQLDLQVAPLVHRLNLFVSTKAHQLDLQLTVLVQ
jgi:hypothetical protein